MLLNRSFLLVRVALRRLQSTSMAVGGIKFPSQELSKLLQERKFDDVIKYLFRVQPYCVISETMMRDTTAKLLDDGKTGNKKAMSAFLSIYHNWNKLIPGVAPGHSMAEEYFKILCDTESIQSAVSFYERSQIDGVAFSLPLVKYLTEKLRFQRMTRDVIRFSSEILFSRRILDSFFLQNYVSSMSEFCLFVELAERLQKLRQLGTAMGDTIQHVDQCLGDAIGFAICESVSRGSLESIKLLRLAHDMDLQLPVRAKCAALECMATDERSDDILSAISRDDQMRRSLKNPSAAPSELLVSVLNALIKIQSDQFMDCWRAWRRTNYAPLLDVLGRKDKAVIAALIANLTALNESQEIGQFIDFIIEKQLLKGSGTGLMSAFVPFLASEVTCLCVLRLGLNV